MIRRVVACLILAAAACGGGPNTPTPAPPAPTPPTPPPAQGNLWTVGGRVVVMGDGSGVAATVVSELGPGTQSDASGAFRVAGNTASQGSVHGFTIDAARYLPHKAYIRYAAGERQNIVFDLIPLAAPFSIDFYRALVRRGSETPGALEPLRRWTTNPRVFVRTVDQNGRPIEPEVMDLVVRTIPESVRVWTGGRLSVAVLETGPETRPLTNGWIRVNIERDPAARYCGVANVGANPGDITLYDDRCSCGSVKISGGLVAHEVGHALGFWHVPDRRHVMYDTIAASCPATEPSPEERFHAAIAYQRPRGNVDPDVDPASSDFAQLQADGQAGPVVYCGLR